MIFLDLKLEIENLGICIKLNSIQILDINFFGTLCLRYYIFGKVYNFEDFWSFFGKVNSKIQKNDPKIFFEAARTSL